MTRMAERYSRAAKSSHLKLEPEPGDVDVIIAAGFADNLGTLLMRCRQEWDAQRAAFELNDEKQRAAEHDAIELARRGLIDPQAMREANAKHYGAEQGAHTSRVFILMNVGSLRRTSEALKRYANTRAAKMGYALEPKEIAKSVGSALDIWLDQRCDACRGRGFNGGYGIPVITCKECRGTGQKRRIVPAKSEALGLAEWLVAEADRLVAAAQRKMSQALR